MKKIIITMIVVLTTMTAWAQTYKFYQTDNIHNQLRLNTKTGEVSQIQDDNQTFLVHPSTTQDNEISNKYELFKTKNMWTYILLDKDTGKLWQCQYSVKGNEYRSSWAINLVDLSSSKHSRFTIQPLTSMYQYYLIDEETGEMWKFQWTTDGENYRWIVKF